MNTTSGQQKSSGDQAVNGVPKGATANSTPVPTNLGTLPQGTATTNGETTGPQQSTTDWRTLHQYQEPSVTSGAIPRRLTDSEWESFPKRNIKASTSYLIRPQPCYLLGVPAEFKWGPSCPLCSEDEAVVDHSGHCATRNTWGDYVWEEADK